MIEILTLRVDCLIKTKKCPTYVVPTFHKEPPNVVGVHVPGWSARKLFHDLGFGPIYLDVSWCRAAGWVTGISGADVGDFEHHV